MSINLTELKTEMIERAAELMREGSTQDIRLRAMGLVARLMGWYVKRSEHKLVTEFSSPEGEAIGYQPARAILRIVENDDE